jgi:hypothetical protein
VDPRPLNPAQNRVVVGLMAMGRPRPRFDPDLGGALRNRLEQALAPVAEDLGDEQLWVRKHDLARVHACEGHFLADKDVFGWNARTATGTVVHKALELSVSGRGDAHPLDLVDHAMETLAADDHARSPSPYLRSAPELDLAELRARANEVVAKFLECWPPLLPAWSPRTETGIGAELCAGRVVLWGKVDLALGRAAGNEARVLLVDRKTGRSHGGHADDLRFYALVQTLRVGVPPFRVASYYLDTATFHAEDVTTEVLEISVRRVVDGVGKIARLRHPGAAATLSAGPACGFCAAREACDGAAAYRAAADT